MITTSKECANHIKHIDSCQYVNVKLYDSYFWYDEAAFLINSLGSKMGVPFIVGWVRIGMGGVQKRRTLIVSKLESFYGAGSGTRTHTGY